MTIPSLSEDQVLEVLKSSLISPPIVSEARLNEAIKTADGNPYISEVLSGYITKGDEPKEAIRKTIAEVEDKQKTPDEYINHEKKKDKGIEI